MTRAFITAFIAVVLSGCATVVPVAQKFPEAPQILLTQCEELKPADSSTTSIVDLLRVVVDNYSIHYTCAARYTAWIEWYRAQRQIFESLQTK